MVDNNIADLDSAIAAESGLEDTLIAEVAKLTTDFAVLVQQNKPDFQPELDALTARSAKLQAAIASVSAADPSEPSAPSSPAS